jgi:hypothetical protein
MRFSPYCWDCLLASSRYSLTQSKNFGSGPFWACAEASAAAWFWCLAGFQRRDDALGAAQVVEGGQRLVVGDADVLGAADVLQPGVLGADAGVVQAGRDRMRLDDLAVVVLQQVGAVAVQHAGRRDSEAACLPLSMPSPAASTPIRRTPFVRDVGVEDAHRVAAAAHAGDHGIGLAARHSAASAHLRQHSRRSRAGSRAPSSGRGAGRPRCR